MKMIDNNKKDSKKKGKLILLLITIVIYGVVFIFFRSQSYLILKSFWQLTIKIVPIFLLIYVLMIIVNYFLDNDILKKYMANESGWKGWIISVGAGIISMGPLYIWYPLLKNLQQQGVKNRFLVSFLYNRGIKLQWAPLLIAYFGWAYSVTLLIVMAVLSIPQGIITEKLINH